MPDCGHPHRGSIYRKLAPIYDDIMHDVDYHDWTDFVDSVFQYHHPYGTKLLELACGTGTMALELEKRNNYDITATDISPEMIRIAREKGEKSVSTIQWLVQDMCHLDLDNKFDIIFMVFDSLNYLHKEEDILSLLERVRQHLEHDGIFVFDFTTPRYSPRVAPLLNEDRTIDEYCYQRISSYNEEKQIHTNHFFVEKKDRQTDRVTECFEEVHRQRIWSLQELRAILLHSPLHLTTAYEDFDLSSANDNSERITMVLTHV